jgi:hypothetical protein
MTHDYVRNGTASLFSALDLADDSVISQPYGTTATRSSSAFLTSPTPPSLRDLDLHLVLDNYATHKPPKSVRRQSPFRIKGNRATGA